MTGGKWREWISRDFSGGWWKWEMKKGRGGRGREGVKKGGDNKVEIDGDIIMQKNGKIRR